MGAVFYGLKKRGMEDCVNIIITADHGEYKTQFLTSKCKPINH